MRDCFVDNKWVLVHDGKTYVKFAQEPGRVGAMETQELFDTEELGLAKIDDDSLTPRIMDGRGPDLSSTTLNDTLVYHLTMDETSGSRLDGVNSHDAAQVNTPGYVAGKNGNAVDFNGTTQRLVMPNHADINRESDDWSLIVGFKADDLIGIQKICGRWTSTTGNRQFFLAINATNIYGQFKTAGGTTRTVTATTFGPISADTWYFVELYKTGTTVGIRVNDQDSPNIYNMSEHLQAVTTDMYFGTAEVTSSNYFNGKICFAEFRTEKLTDDESEEEYDSGDWLTHPY